MSSKDISKMTVWSTPDIIWIVFQKKIQAKNEQSSSVALLWVGQIRSGIVCEPKQVLKEHDGYFSNISVTYNAVLP